jgi:glycerol-3-phosphate dehydrogenase
VANRSFSVLHRDADLRDATVADLDVLVVGLGATGAGIALDAASRGLDVVAVDRGDFACGTSSKSSKLIHGGLRYLENYEFSLVLEGVSERQTLMRLAPHLVRPMDFVYPVWPDTARRRLLGLGLTTYDVFAGMRNVRRHDRVTAERAVQLAPALADSGLSYAYVYGDCATDDARLVLAIVREARRFGAVALPYLEVVELLHGPDGRIVGAVAEDRLAGGRHEIHARHVVNATGVWVDRLLQAAEPGRPRTVQPSKGVHVVVPHARLPLTDASVLLPSMQGDRRSMFAIDWGRQTILGTTDTAYDGPLDQPSPTAADLEYVLAAANAVFGQDLTADDVVGAWAGVRPLLRSADATEAMSDLSRRHVLFDRPDGLLTITGGKLTTYRRMAKDVVDRIVEIDGVRARCVTDEIPLGLHRPYEPFREEILSAAAALDVPVDAAKLLLRMHGETAADVLSLVTTDHAYADRLSPEADHLVAEVVYAARQECAATLEDVFSRRTRMSLRVRDAGLSAAPLAARLLARELAHDDDWAAAQVQAYADSVRAERGVLGLPSAVPVP